MAPTRLRLGRSFGRSVGTEFYCATTQIAHHGRPEYRVREVHYPNSGCTGGPTSTRAGEFLQRYTASGTGPHMAEFGGTKDGETTNRSVREAEAWFRLLIENVEDYAVFLLGPD